MNIISTLTTDHRNVDSLFKRFEAADASDHVELANLRDLILEQLAVHAQIEEQTLYPALRGVAGDAVLEALEEHHALKSVLAELEPLAPTAERFRAKMQVAIDLVRHHVDEEEGEDGLFAAARLHLKQPEMESMAETAEAIRAAGPTRPHAWLPDQPPFNVLLGLPVAVFDRATSLAKDVAARATLGRRA